MVHFTASPDALNKVDADAVFVGVPQGVDWTKKPASALNATLAGLPAEAMALPDYRAKLKETRLVITRGLLKPPRLVLVGLGKPAEFTRDALRDWGARVALVARDLRLKRIAVALPAVAKLPPVLAAETFAEGFGLGSFEYREFKSEEPEEDRPRVTLDEVRLVGVKARDRAKVLEGVRAGEILAESTNLARTLILRPSIEKGPEALAKVAVAEAKKHKVWVEVLHEPDLRRLKMGALLGVGQGSARPPCMVLLRHKGRGRRVLLCGKGIVFDSGGINIKPSEGMEKMKYDMSGAAAVLGAVLAAARLKVKADVVGILAVAENMPSGTAIRPGDVLRAHNGKTIEVGNTDAEGRLVLADALSYGVERFKPEAIVDVATLTGAVRIALGNIMVGVLGNDDGIIAQLHKAGASTGDDLWRLPLTKAYEKQVQSDIADVRNTGAGGAGTIAGAAFLKQFVGKAPWAHLDIAGTAWTDKGPGDLQKDYHPKGPTGIGVRLLAQWLRDGKA